MRSSKSSRRVRNAGQRTTVPQPTGDRRSSKEAESDVWRMPATKRQHLAVRRACSKLEGESRKQRERRIGNSSDASQGEEDT